jgi:hypothetical protein
MKDSDQDVQEIDPLVLNRTKLKKCRGRIVKDPLDPIFVITVKETKATNKPLILKMSIPLLFQTPLQTLRKKMLVSDKLFLLFGLDPLLSTVNAMLIAEKLCLHISFTEFKLLLKQFTSIVIDQLERCELPLLG